MFIFVKNNIYFGWDNGHFSGNSLVSVEDFINCLSAKRFEKCALMIVFTLMFGAVIAFVFSMTYTYLETQARFRIDVN